MGADVGVKAAHVLPKPAMPLWPRRMVRLGMSCG